MVINPQCWRFIAGHYESWKKNNQDNPEEELPHVMSSMALSNAIKDEPIRYWRVHWNFESYLIVFGDCRMSQLQWTEGSRMYITFTFSPGDNIVPFLRISNHRARSEPWKTRASSAIPKPDGGIQKYRTAIYWTLMSIRNGGQLSSFDASLPRIIIVVLFFFGRQPIRLQ